MKCIACQKPVGVSDYKHESGDERLCLGCFAKVVRGGREPLQTIEAVLFFENDPDVGGPDDPLDHEDYRDLELLGLWPRTDAEGLHGQPVTEAQAEAMKVGDAVRLWTGGKGDDSNDEREIVGTVARVDRVEKRSVGQKTTVEVEVKPCDGSDAYPLCTWRGTLRYGSGLQEVRSMLS
jgi:hypothetical protein